MKTVFDDRMRKLAPDENVIEKQTFKDFINRWNKNNEDHSTWLTFSRPINVYVHFWFQTDEAMIILLSDSTLQVKYFH